MTKFEFLKMNHSLLNLLVENQISLRDLGNLAVYEEYRKINTGEYKNGYVIGCLMDKFHLSERCIYNIINRMNKKMKI